MGQEILDKYQRQFLEGFAKNRYLSGKFYLSGGTALSAFYLNHRFSEDLDFLTPQDFTLLEIEPFIDQMQKTLHSHKKSFASIFDRRIFFFKINDKELKVEFTKYPFKQLKKPKIVRGLKIDSLIDIGANKLFSIFDRTEVKDFVDLYFIIKSGYPLKTIYKNMQKKFSLKIDPITLGGQIAKISKINTLPLLIVKISLSEIKSFLAKEALSLRGYF